MLTNLSRRTGCAVAALIGCWGSAGSISAHDVITTKLTWCREISRIFYKRCITCHREGGSAFDLTDYAHARPWAEAIKEEVLERRMPPWGAVKGFGRFRDDPSLSQEDIELISAWVVGGAPEGERNILAPVPSLSSPKPAAPKAVAVPLRCGMPLKEAAVVAGLRPEALPNGSSLRLVAELPDGNARPLIWIYRYPAKFPQTYWFDGPVRMPAGTRIQMFPAGAATFSLLLQR
ncbi:MAG: cytochrome c [Bryobacteraceae bacterium]